ncbi:S-layer family protein, partial [Cellvibrio sp. BR]|uniref:beta strand repeat-containing protein n=1 Tax=Cellvibrio sp. BR TaxID=1134474 RepID=UPI00058ADA10
MDFTETITLSEVSAGILTNGTQAATAGVATFTNLTYTATADQQAFTLTANDQDGVGSNLSTVDANSVTSDVVATQLVFDTQPAPTSVVSGQNTSFTTVPVVSARDANSVVDTGYSTGITLAEVNGAGSATMTGTADTDGNGATVSITPSSGVSTFTGMQITYTNSGAGSETFNLRASSGGLTTADSSQLTAATTPTVTDGNISISGASGTGGAFKIGDTVTATWNNTGGGDANAGITGVTVDFSQFGGGAAVVASNSGDSWTATYTIVSGGIDTTNRNVSVTATNASGDSTTADTTNATVDNTAPVVTNNNLSISGATGTSGAYKIGDTVTATWNNTGGGDNNSDISGATVDFSAFGGGAAVAATNSSGTWTATYTITAGAIDTSNLNVSVTATDNAGNTTTAADSSNATVDSQAPTVTDGSISISGGSGGGGGFIIGDTVTATWNNTVGGDNNGDTISTVTVDFTGFGGGAAVAATNSAGTWTATYTIVSGVIDGTNRNVAVTATDNAGNITTTVDTSNASVDNIAPAVSSVSVPANATYIAGQNLDFIVNTSQNITVSTTGGTPQIALTLGASTVYASYLSGSGSSALTFRYTLQAGDLDADGIALAGVIDLSGGTLKDGSGNDLNLTLNSVGSTAAVLVDAVVPNAPSAPDLADLSDSGNNTDNITNDTTPTLTGTAEAGSTVTLYDTDGTTVLGTATATGGNWSITSTTLSEGSHSLTAKATDTAGNESDASGVLTITIDTTVHAKPIAPVLATASDTGNSNSDGITNLTTLTLQGAAGSVEANASVHARSDLEGGLTGTTANADGSWTLVVSSLSEGIHQLTIRATDVAGNQSVYSDPLSVVIDTTVPTVSSVAFDQANVTVANRTAISLSLAGAETGTKASYSITSNNGGTPVTATGLAVSSVAQQFTGIDVTGLNDGTLTVSLTLVDLAGNTSTAVTNTISKDANVPEVTSVAITSGNYAEGDVIGVTINLNEDVTVSGTNSALAIDIGGVTRQAVFVSENAGVLTYQYTVQANDNTSGTGVIALANGLSLNGDTILDAGNNPASLVYAQASNVNAQVDTTAPVGVVVASPATAVSVNADEYTINGTHVENGVTITLYLDADNDGVADNGLVLDSVVVTGGAWSLSAPLTADSANNFVIVVEDAAGNLSAAVDVPTITEDSIAPAAPAAADLLAASDSGASDTDDLTSNTTPTLTGTAEPNSTVTLTSDLDGVVGTAVADGAGDWSITASTLSPGVHSLTTTATDAADNVSTLSAALSITVDNQAPTLSAIANQSLNPGASSSALAVTLADDSSTPANLTFTATSSNVAVVPLANLVLGGADADRTITVTALGSGTSTITLSVEDEAGNTGTGTFTVSVNGAPTISGTPTTSINQGAPYSFIPTAVDGDGDGLTFSINTTPAWASFNPATGALTGTPTNADVGTTSGIVISVSDGTLSTSLSAFDLTVVNTNDAPLISGTPTTSVDQDVAYSFTPTASDVDVGDVLTYNITNKPTWAAFDAATGALTGTPTNTDVGTTTGIVITVSDGTLSASLAAFDLTVTNVNEAPVISGTPLVSVDQDVAYSFTPTASDVDVGDVLTYSITNKPTWAAFDTATGALTGTPVYDDVGTTTGIVITVS